MYDDSMRQCTAFKIMKFVLIGISNKPDITEFSHALKQLNDEDEEKFVLLSRALMTVNLRLSPLTYFVICMALLVKSIFLALTKTNSSAPLFKSENEEIEVYAGSIFSS